MLQRKRVDAVLVSESVFLKGMKDLNLRSYLKVHRRRHFKVNRSFCNLYKRDYIMKEAQRMRFRDRLATKQARSVILLALALAIVFSVLQIYTDYFRQKKRLDSNVLQVINTMKQTAIQAAYLVNSPFAMNVAKGLFEYQPIVDIKIFDDFNVELASLKRPIAEHRLRRISDILLR